MPIRASTEPAFATTHPIAWEWLRVAVLLLATAGCASAAMQPSDSPPNDAPSSTDDQRDATPAPQDAGTSMAATRAEIQAGSGDPVPRDTNDASLSASEDMSRGATGSNSAGADDDACELPRGEWIAMNDENAPAGTDVRVVVWTGDEMLAITGEGAGRFDPCANRWSPINTDGMPPGLNGTRAFSFYPLATGGKVLFFYNGPHVAAGETVQHATGVIYDLSADRWIEIPLPPLADYPPRLPAIGFDGSYLLIWGGGTEELVDNVQQLHHRSEGAVFDAAAGTWSLMTTANAPEPRAEMGVAQLGSELALWGGASGTAARYTTCGRDYGECQLVGSGARYDPRVDRWTAIDPTNAPEPRLRPTLLALSGDRLLVWGGFRMLDPAEMTGFSPLEFVASGALYDAATGWTAFGAPPLSDDAVDGTLTAYGLEDHLVVIGRGPSSAVFDPSTESWREVSGEFPLGGLEIAAAPGGTTNGRGLFVTRRADLSAELTRLDPQLATFRRAPLPEAGQPMNASFVWGDGTLIAWPTWTEAVVGEGGCDDVPPGFGCDPFLITENVYDQPAAYIVPEFDMGSAQTP